MKIIMTLLLIFGLFVLGSGISTWISAINSEEVAGVFFGITFAYVFMILGGVILLFDLILLIIYLLRRKEKPLK